jgi:hypothetical protein
LTAVIEGLVLQFCPVVIGVDPNIYVDDPADLDAAVCLYYFVHSI